jgi:hypothetical protein
MIDDKLQAYCSFFGSLTPETLDNLNLYVTEDIRFCDPFHDVVGINSLQKIFEKMFKKTKEPHFIIQHGWMIPDQSNCGYIAWRFKCTVWRKDICFDGVSKVTLHEDGRVIEHIDYWDSVSQLYIHVPYLGRVARLISSR